MVDYLLKTLQSGVIVMRTNSKMWLVFVLVFVFPALFIFVTQSFLQTATDNIVTIQKQKVNLLHTSIAEILVMDAPGDEDRVTSVLNNIVIDNPDIVTILVSNRINDELTIKYGNDESVVSTKLEDTFGYDTLPINERESIILNSENNGQRVWESYRLVKDGDTNLYIYTEQNFLLSDQVLYSRVQQSYLVLTVIFLFLICLAYWVSRQTFWQKQYELKRIEIEERDVFSNMIAHEFRTPLTAIKGFASFLKESDSIVGEDKRFVANISQSTERLIYLVNDFLEVAKLQSGTLILNKETFNLKTITDVVIKELSSINYEKDIDLVSEVPADINLTTDKTRMIQVLINLVTNSLKYTEKGHVVISAEMKRTEVEIYIQDTGTGISGKDQRKLFKPFSRVGQVETSDITGSGLGMWITKQLVSLLGGEVNLESIEGIGTRVVLSFKVD